MRILSQNQLDALRAEQIALFQKYGITAGYAVAEIFPKGQQKADYIVCIVANTPDNTMSPFLDQIGSQTYGIIRQLAPKAPALTDN